MLLCLVTRVPEHKAHYCFASTHLLLIEAKRLGIEKNEHPSTEYNSVEKWEKEGTCSGTRLGRLNERRKRGKRRRKILWSTPYISEIK